MNAFAPLVDGEHDFTALRGSTIVIIQSWQQIDQQTNRLSKPPVAREAKST